MAMSFGGSETDVVSTEVFFEILLFIFCPGLSDGLRVEDDGCARRPDDREVLEKRVREYWDLMIESQPPKC